MALRRLNRACQFCLLVELLCVLSCSNVRSRAVQDKNEAHAEQTVKHIRAAEATFKRSHAKFGSFNELVDAGLLTTALTDGMNAEYQFRLSAGVDSYEVIATPTKRDDAFQYVGWSFFLDESGVIRGAPYGKANGYRVAGRADEPIPQQ